ncbi:DUF6760 family protein [Georgenia sp. 311]|uniref:DUF6760 family protein n=1 Tax=Georgenia sp. 311 TaxID=2585134 RepID=UPI00159BACE9|nr:DUF6760 family protein [Georgenia sp. 311]
MTGYPLDWLNEEMAFLAYHFHWDLNQIMRLEHADRRRWVQQISDLNDQVNSLGET